jgi:diketogulonate reductase-like aldo/keto reductase
MLTLAATAPAIPRARDPRSAANDYHNQRAVGDAIRASTHRESVFITTKVPGCSASTPAECEASTAADIDDDLAQLGFRNVDLLLVHFPPRPFPWRADEAGCSRMRAQWRAMEAAYKAGKARAIGVSNYCPSCFECLKAPSSAAAERGAPHADADPPATITPAVNQVQFHVGMGLDPGGIASYCANHGVLLQAYSPLGDGRSRELISGPLVSAIGAQNGRSGVQTSLKYVAQLGYGVVTKSTNAQHLADDIDLFGWQLSPSQMRALAAAQTPWANYSFTCMQ